MTRFGFAVNPTSEAAVAMGKRAVSWCRERGVTAWLDEAKPFLAKGPTGLPVRTLVRLAMEWKD